MSFVRKNGKPSFIAVNEDNNLALGEVSITTDGLETLINTTNTTLTAMLVDTDAIDSSLNTIEAQSVLTASRLNNIQNKIAANVDGTGDTLGQINSNMLSKITDAEVHLGNIQTAVETLDNAVDGNYLNVNQNIAGTDVASNSGNKNAQSQRVCIATDDIPIALVNTNLVALEASLTSMESKMDTDNVVFDNTLTKITANETLLTAIDADTNAIKTAVELIDNAVDGNYLNVNQNIAGTDVASNSGNKNAQSQRVCIATDDIPIALVNTNLVALEASLTSMESKMDTDNVVFDNTLTKITANETLLTAIDADTNAIKTAVELIDNAVDGNYLNVNQNIAGTDVASNSGNKNAQSQRVCIATDDIPIALVNTNLVALETSLTAIESDIEASNVLLTAIDSDTNDIKTAIELLDNALDGNYLNANINIAGGDVDSSSGNLSSKTQRVCIATDDIPIALVNTNLVALEASLTSMESKMDTDNVVFDNTLTKITANETLLTAIDADTNAIKTAVEALDNAVDGNYLNVNQNIAGTDVASNSGNKNAQTQRVCIATDDIPIALVNTTLSAAEVHLSSLDSLARANISTGSSQLADSEEVGPVNCSAFSEICVVYLTTTSTSGKKIFITGSTTEGGTYNPFAQMSLIQLQGDSGGSVNAYMYGSGNSNQNNAEFIPVVYPFIKIKNNSGGAFTDTDDIRIIGR